MEIAPIPGIRAVAALRSPQSEMRAPAIFDIDPSSRPDDERERQTKRKAADAEENEDDDSSAEVETTGRGAELEEARSGQVDFFA